MKLHNKKTGIIGYIENVMRTINPITGDPLLTVRYKDEHGRTCYDDYETVAEFNENWEDYEPVEPLIKDEKIRKAVRAWAEANGIGGCICKEEIHCITFETERGMFISFENVDSIPPEGNYTIEELCGEEEE